MKKVLISLILILCISSAIAKARVSAGGDNSGGGYSILNIHGGDSGDLYSKGGINGGGGRSISGQDSGSRSKHSGEGGEDGKTI